MRTFEKADKLNGVCYDVRGPVLDEANRMKQDGEEILQLNIGNPAPFGFRTMPVVLDALRDAIEDPMSQGYSDSKGILEAREAILDYHKSKGLPNIDVDHIYIGNGVSELISMSMQGLLSNGDEILIPAPDYPLWTGAAQLAGGTPVHYICDEKQRWYPDIKDIESKITDRTKGIVIINPNNPTGVLYPKEVLEEIVEIARKHELIIFSDEMYDRVVMDGKEHVSIASLAPDLFCVTFNGLSKSHKIAGYRVGWMILSGDLSKGKGYIEGLNMLSSMRLCANVPSQYVIAPALRNRPEVDETLLPGGRIYEQRKCVCEAVNDIDGLSVQWPDGAFYVFPKIDAKRFNIHDDEKFVLDFLKAEHVLLVQGTGFNWPEPDHFRIVYLPDVDVLSSAMSKMGHFLETYRQED
jgi:alanine-synthesizing transaminase